MIIEYDGTNYHITTLNHDTDLEASALDKVNPIQPININGFEMDAGQHIIYMDAGNNNKFTIMDTVENLETSISTTFTLTQTVVE